MTYKGLFKYDLTPSLKFPPKRVRSEDRWKHMEKNVRMEGDGGLKFPQIYEIIFGQLLSYTGITFVKNSGCVIQNKYKGCWLISVLVVLRRQILRPNRSLTALPTWLFISQTSRPSPSHMTWQVNESPVSRDRETPHRPVSRQVIAHLSPVTDLLSHLTSHKSPVTVHSHPSPVTAIRYRPFRCVHPATQFVSLSLVFCYFMDYNHCALEETSFT